MDGTGRQLLVGAQISYINVVDDWIYYGIYGKGIYKIKTDGTDKTKISDDEPMFINISGDWLYYGTGSQEETIKIKTDGTEKQIVN